MDERRLGADAFIEQLLAAEVRWIFGNPGTTEQAVIDALQDYDGIDLVVALHEGIAVSAAEGYARASGEVGVVELHAGPGLGNGMGMLYNAKAGQTPMVVYVGQSEQSALFQEPMLSGDFVALAAPFTKWAYEVRTTEEIPQIVRRAFKVAQTPPRGPVMLSIPIDLTAAPCDAAVVAPSVVRMDVRPAPAAVEEAIDALLAAESPAIIAGDGVVSAGAMQELGAFARLIGAPIFAGSLSETGVDPDEPLRAARLPLEGSGSSKLLQPFDAVVAVGSKVLHQIFPLPDSPLGDRTFIHVGLDPWELAKNQSGVVVFGDEREALVALTERCEARLDATARDELAARRYRVEGDLAASRQRLLAADRERWDLVPMSRERAMYELAEALPDDVCVVGEPLTSGEALARYLRPGPGKWYRGRGGGIGTGMAMAIGVQLARPAETVACIVGDGSSMYSIASLWTGAHYELPIIWVILNNRSYRILKENTVRHRGPGANGRQFVGADITSPDLDFVALARGMGVDGCRVTEPGAIADAVSKFVAEGKPALIELVINGDL